MERVGFFCAIILINIYIAWRYSDQPIGPDEAHYAGWGILGAKPYKDYIDIKPPGIHLWMKLLAYITNGSLPAMKFIHHATIGLIMAYVYLFTGSIGAALMGTALSQSAWFYAYQSWGDALSGALILLGFVAPPWVALIAFGLALLVNYKLGPAGLIFMIFNGWWLQIGVASALAVLVLGGMYIFARPTIKAIWYGSVTVAGRVKKYRVWRLNEFVRWPPYHGVALLLAIPALVVLFHYGDLPVILAILSYLLLNGWGRVTRPPHWLPLSAAAAVLPPPEIGLLFLLVDMASTRFLTVRNIWAVTYPGIASEIIEAREIGRLIRKELGTDKTLWVNTFHAQIYLYAGIFPRYGYEFFEIRDVVPEFMQESRRKLRTDKPDIVVDGPFAAKWNPEGYSIRLQTGAFRVWM